MAGPGKGRSSPRASPEGVVGPPGASRSPRLRAPPGKEGPGRRSFPGGLLGKGVALLPAYLPRAERRTSEGAAVERRRAHGCGEASYQPLGRVVNGEDAVPYSWPWQVSLRYESGGEFYHTCGGTLIAPDWVMTAGHCISASLRYKVVLGEYDRSVDEGPEQHILVNPEDIFVHPGWNDNCVSCGDDIALLKLSRSAELDDKVQLGCLPPQGELLPNGAPCYITGWGRLYTGGPLPSKLQQAVLPAVDHAHCSQADWWGSTVKESMVCAGGDIRAGCNGDSGGPLNCQAGDGRWYVHGVTSFVSAWGCNTLKKPTVFTRVSAFNAWIEETISSH